MSEADDYYPVHLSEEDRRRIKKEREKAKALRKTPWWKERIRSGLCHYCGLSFRSSELTMDHLVPLARGGTSSKNNLVPACKGCNSSKKLSTPVDLLLRQLREDSEG